jgi:hypothetical protein
MIQARLLKFLKKNKIIFDKLKMISENQEIASKKIGEAYIKSLEYTYSSRVSRVCEFLK